MLDNGYAHPETLVDTDWVARNLDDPHIQLVEVDNDINAYYSGHIPNAVALNWQVDAQDSLRRNIISQQGFENLLKGLGISNETSVILYGDRNNLFACYAFWLFKYYGHSDVRLLNGGRKKWLAEKRPLVQDEVKSNPSKYKAQSPNETIRIYRDQVLMQMKQNQVRLVDTRSAKEYSGDLIAPEYLPQEGAQRGGHIPGALNIPWGNSVQRDGCFKSVAELQSLYKQAGISADQDIIVYCRIGERSALTWFVLTYLLGYPKVRNYDGSWTEWGNLINAPIER